MRILLSLSSYINLTGSEIYTYELARELSSRDYKVTILANQIGGEIAKKTQKWGNIKVYPFFDHPDELTADLIINSQPLPTTYMLRKFSGIPQFQVIHSLYKFESPIVDANIKRYIAVRPEIKEHWLKEMPELKNKVSVVWNGFDTTRFNTKNNQPIHPDTATRLFIGTVDQLRRYVIQDLLNDVVKSPTSRLWLMLDQNPFQSQQLPANVEVFTPRWNTESLIKQCSETAGIFVGRTTIEGFLCGKPALVYDVDANGAINKKYSMSVPEKLEQFDIKYMADKILEIYNTARYV